MGIFGFNRFSATDFDASTDIMCIHLYIIVLLLTSVCGGWLSCYLMPLLFRSESSLAGSKQGAAIFTIERGSGWEVTGSLLHNIRGVDWEVLTNSVKNI